jgi:thiamine biosynthesis lipoprotein
MKAAAATPAAHTEWPLLPNILVLLLNMAVAASAPPAPESAAAPTLTRFEFVQIHMGMKTRLVLYTPDAAGAESAARAAFARIAQLDGMLSDYRVDSELTRLSNRAGGDAVPVSAELFKVLTTAQAVSRASHGGFDVSVGPLVALWRQARRSSVMPSDDERRAALARVGYEKILLDPASRTVRLTQPGMRLDLGAIAKGYIGDEAIATLAACGVRMALFEAGGDVVLGDAPPDKPGWTIDFGPFRLDLHNCGVSASGDSVQYVVIGGRRYSHVIDPHTGYGLSDRVTASVVAPDGLTSDAVSTAATVLGVEDGTALLHAWPGVWGWVRVVEDDQPPLLPHHVPALGHGIK